MIFSVSINVWQWSGLIGKIRKTVEILLIQINSVPQKKKKLQLKYNFHANNIFLAETEKRSKYTN